MSQNTTLLIGAEQVASAGSRIASAAEDMRSAAATFDNALATHRQWMEDWLSRFEAAFKPIEPVNLITGNTEITIDPDMQPAFDVIEWRHYEDKGWAASINLDPRADFPMMNILGRMVRLDGKAYRCTSTHIDSQRRYLVFVEGVPPSDG